jgi:hypothetical protein
VRFGRHLDLALPVDHLEGEVEAHRRQLDEVVAAQPEVQEHVRALEALQAQQSAVSGEELASEIERYLKDAASGERRPFDEDDDDR